jgi:DNA-binding PadR family transcriptional regulator
MAKRNVTNPLALAVLVLLYERPMHPYEMATTLREREKDQSIKIRFGSLYTVIDRLVDLGWIRAGETVREGRRPERTVYYLTKTGKDEMRDWLRELISTPVKEYPQFEAGLALMPGLAPDEARAMLEERVEHLDEMIEQIEAGLEKAREIGLHELVMVESEYTHAMLTTERDWITSLLRRMADGSWATTPVAPGFPSWEDAHKQREAAFGS